MPHRLLALIAAVLFAIVHAWHLAIEPVFPPAAAVAESVAVKDSAPRD